MSAKQKDFAEDDNSLGVQVYKLIVRYAYDKQSILAQFPGDTMTDFLHTAWIDYMSNFADNYDESKGSLSTYVYTVMKYRTPIYVAQAKHNVGHVTARGLSSNSNPDRRSKLSEMYKFSKNIDACTTSIDLDSDNKEGKECKAQDKNLADPEINVEDEVIREISNVEFLKVFNTCLDSFVNQGISKPNEIKERNKQIILDRLLYNKTLQEIGDTYGITRERVRQLTDKFKRQASKNRQLREFLNC